MKIEGLREKIGGLNDRRQREIAESFVVSAGSKRAQAFYVYSQYLMTRGFLEFGVDPDEAILCFIQNVYLLDHEQEFGIFRLMGELHAGNSHADYGIDLETGMKKGFGQQYAQTIINNLPTDSDFEGLLDAFFGGRKIRSIEVFDRFITGNGNNFGNEDVGIRLSAYINVCSSLGLYDNMLWYNNLSARDRERMVEAGNNILASSK